MVMPLIILRTPANCLQNLGITSGMAITEISDEELQLSDVTPH